MRKTIKFTLLLALVTLLLTVTALAISASPTAPTGSMTQAAEHMFSVQNGTETYYYTDLEAAAADVPANGTIVLLKNAIAGGKWAEGDHPTSNTIEDGYILALSLSRDATYTIDGNGYTLTLTPGYSKPSYDKENGLKASPETSVAVHVTAGIVTFKNLSLTLSASSQADVAFYIQNPKRSLNSVHVTLENVSYHFTHKYGLWAHQHANVTVTGDKTSISGSTINALRIQGGAGASTFTLAGGTVSGTAAGIEIKGTNATFKLTGGVLSAPTPIIVTSKSTFNMTGGTIKIGSTELFSISSSITFTTNLTGGTLIVQNESGVPAYDGIDTSALDLVWAPEYITLPPVKIGSIVISKKQTFSSLNSWSSIVNKSKPSISTTAFKSVTYATLVPILIPSGYTLNITGGDYTTPIDSMETLFYVQGGTLNITGGTFKNTNPRGSIISVYKDSTAVINVSDSLFYATKSFLSIPLTSRASSITCKNITVIMNEYAEKLFDASTFALDAITHTNLTVLSKVACHLFNKTYIDETSPRMLFAGEYYGSYMESAATNTTIDVSNANDAFNGASVYISSAANYSGIRFVTELSSDVITAIKALGGTPSFGTVIAPLDYVLKAGAFTVDALSTLSVTGSKYERIPASKSIRDNDGDGIPESFSAALINLKTQNYTRTFAAIAYMELDGKIYYGSFDAEKNALSISEIAKQCLQISDYFTDTEVELLKNYAGFVRPDDCKLTLTWTRGIVASEHHTTKPLQIATSLAYCYSNVIHIEKAGTAITFTDPNTGIADKTALIISHWVPSGEDYVLDTAAKNHNGTSELISLTAYGETHYTYVSSSDNEYIRICLRQTTTTAPTVYSKLTGELGTDLVKNSVKSPIEKFTINGTNAAKYQIVLTDDYTMKEWYMALYLKNLINQKTNLSLPIHTVSEATDAPRIRIGAINWLLKNDHTYISKILGDTWHLTANSLFAYNSLELYLDEVLFGIDVSTLELDSTHEYIGDGTVAATELITPSGDVRMIFNNLWGNADSQSELRAKMFVELYEAYSPDIVCLQECSPGLRNMGIVPGMTALGFNEVPSDPKNTYYQKENVTRNPIFYNTETVVMLDYGFYQLATMDFGKYPELMGGYTKTQLYNVAKDDGSKSVTWGIFQSKKTGDIFLVGSTHLWWKGEAIDDVVRTIQMRELREVLTAAAASYMKENGLTGTMPVICGGDYNSRMSTNSYPSMSNGEVPFTNLNDLVTDTAHKLTNSSTHGYPTWHPGFGIWSNVDSNANNYDNAIDHIFCSKETADMITVNHMGMPFEKHFAFMSDHSAIFADVTFK